MVDTLYHLEIQTVADTATCLLIDASCDVPPSVLAHPQVKLLPVGVMVGSYRYLDDRSAHTTLDFYRANLNSSAVMEASSEPLSVDEIAAFMLDHTAVAFDRVLGVFVSSTRSPIYERAQKAMERTKTSSFTKRVREKKLVALEQLACDSLALFAGYGVQVMSLLDAIDQARDSISLETLAQLQHQYQEQSYIYLAPGDVSYILKRAKAKGEKSVGMVAGFAAKTLAITPIIRGHMGQTEPVARKRGAGNAREMVIDFARTCLAERLVLSKHICFSYSGQLGDVQSMPSYQALLADAQMQGIAVHLCLMSMTGSVNVGPDTLSFGMLAKPHDASSLL
ncbi:DegV family protein [Variovorax sp. PCZ-1]|uniref:DegV family protein n=1 Tax=Variovorax sp. PCZ-1 TaxID=2835533 RepID=UPI001BCAE850|nr:DegV family protein [Variovorax sp. PCZ-1]MBS7807580.1 DegV family protein [Variovorax sp. PCZ-1]